MTLALPTPSINSRPNWVAEPTPLRSTLSAMMSLVCLASSGVDAIMRRRARAGGDADIGQQVERHLGVERCVTDRFDIDVGDAAPVNLAPQSPAGFVREGPRWRYARVEMVRYPACVPRRNYRCHQSVARYRREVHNACNRRFIYPGAIIVPHSPAVVPRRTIVRRGANATAAGKPARVPDEPIPGSGATKTVGRCAGQFAGGGCFGRKIRD